MLCTTLNPFVAVGALIIPSSIYTILKVLVYSNENLEKMKKFDYQIIFVVSFLTQLFHNFSFYLKSNLHELRW